MVDGEKRLSYIRAFLTVLVFYGLALILDYLQGGAIFRVSPREDAGTMLGWPPLLALWWMVILHLPLLVHFYFGDTRVNVYYSNDFVFRALFVTWYGCAALIGFIAIGLGVQHGWWVVAGVMLGIILAGRGARARRLVDFGSTCASFFVFYRASGDVPPRLWLTGYVAIAIVQCALLAFAEQAMADRFDEPPPPEK